MQWRVVVEIIFSILPSMKETFFLEIIVDEKEGENVVASFGLNQRQILVQEKKTKFTNFQMFPYLPHQLLNRFTFQ